MNLNHRFSRLHSTGMYSDINLHFAEFLAGRCGGSPEVFIAAASVSRAASQGHVCMDLENFIPTDDPVFQFLPPACRNPRRWGEILLEKGAAVEPGGSGPLVLEKPSRLYLLRYWQYEKDLAERLLARAEAFSDPALSTEALVRIRKNTGSRQPDWQTVAAFTSLIKKLCIISGGPGTGKTTTVGAIISAAFIAHEHDPPRIALAAPTGKAAARLQEAVAENLSSRSCHPRSHIPEASTIHRLLGVISGSPYFRHHAGNPLPFDIVVVDEASMVDLALMAKLVRAVPDRARLIILGDRDQLSSVEAGAVLGDMCGVEDMNRFSSRFIEAAAGLGLAGAGEEQASPLADCIVELRTSHRFGDSSGIGRVSRAVRTGNGPEALNLLRSGDFPDASWRRLPAPDEMAGLLTTGILGFYREIVNEETPEKVLDLFEHFRILCALRDGPFGVSAVNRLIERILDREGLIRPDRKWYRGRPILVTSNDYNLNLFNGDLGIILPDPSAEGRLQAFFRSADRTVRSFSAGSLPDHETVYAMTVHKSQGTEFEEALLILPDRPSPVLTRELVYTGLTRARKRIEIWGRPEVFIQATGSRTRRTSGLRNRLWGS